MKKKLCCFCITLLIIIQISAQTDHSHDVYDLDLKNDLILMGGGIALTVLGDVMLRKADKPNLEEIANLNVSDLWSIDRNATTNFSKTAERTSDIILYTSAALPFTLYALDKTKGEELEVLMMTLETFLITNGTTNIVKALTQRYRPFNYNPDVPDEMKLGSTSRQSFFSGHASNTAAFCFLTAQNLTDMHPHWRARKYITWGVAAALPLAISYGRYKAGKHFPTDVITGYLFGAGVGLLIPRIHRSKSHKITVGPGHMSFNLTF